MPRGYSQRYREMCNRRGVEFWSIVFGYPVARALLAIAPAWRVITPMRLTVLGFVTKITAIVLLLWWCDAVWIAFALLQAAQVADSMDGTLARYRRQRSAPGAFADKVGDMLTLCLLAAAVGWLGTSSSGDPLYLLYALGGALCFALVGYMYWLRESLIPRDAESDRERTSPPTWTQIIAEWLAGWLRLPLCQEADLYLWLGLLVALGHAELACIVLFASQAITLLVRAPINFAAVRGR